MKPFIVFNEMADLCEGRIADGRNALDITEEDEVNNTEAIVTSGDTFNPFGDCYELMVWWFSCIVFILRNLLILILKCDD